MENLLFQRIKNLIPRSRLTGFAFLLIVVVLTVLYFVSFHFEANSEEDIYNWVSKGIRKVENNLGKKIDKYRYRAEEIGRKYLSNKLEHADLHEQEALILEHNGIVKEYWGEIYHFSFPDIQSGEWSFIERKDNIYFLQKMAENLYYMNYFCNLQDNMVKKVLKYDFAVIEIKFSDIPLENHKNQYQPEAKQRILIFGFVLLTKIVDVKITRLIF